MNTTPTVIDPVNAQKQSEPKKPDTANTVATKKNLVRDITREKWFWDIAVPS